MRWRGTAGWIIGLALLTTACNLPVPQVTPTAPPTRTATRTPIATATATATAPATATATTTATATATSTETATATSTETATATTTATATATSTILPSATHTATATATHTATATATHTATTRPTLTPILTVTPSVTPTATATALPTITPSRTPTPTATPTPSSTPTPTLDGTLIRSRLQTQAARTPSPPAPPATLDTTPTFITATPGGAAFTPAASPIASTPQGLPAAPSPTNTPPPSPAPPTAIGFPLPVAFDPLTADAYTFDLPGGSVSISGQTVGGAITLFAANPVYPASYARTDPNGMLYFAPPPGGNEGTMTFAPFFDGYMPDSAEENKNRIREMAWAPNGEWLAYIIDPPGGTDNQNAGIWFWQPDTSLPTDPTYTLLRDCPNDTYSSCNIVARTDGGAGHWQSLKLAWSPDSQRILVTLALPDEGRQALAVVAPVRDAQYANRQPVMPRYDSGTWTPDGRILVSGRDPQGRAVIAIADRDLNNPQVIFDAGAAGLWVQDAAMRPGGAILAFGKPGAPDGPLMLINAVGQFLSAPIGDGPPQNVNWFADRSGAVLTINGRQYTVMADGRVLPHGGPGN
jgi:hypothetical protein